MTLLTIPVMIIDTQSYSSSDPVEYQKHPQGRTSMHNNIFSVQKQTFSFKSCKKVWKN